MWIEIEDKDVEILFKKGKEEAHVTPAWMAECGTPVTMEGEDMELVSIKVNIAGPATCAAS